VVQILKLIGFIQLIIKDQHYARPLVEKELKQDYMKLMEKLGDLPSEKLQDAKQYQNGFNFPVVIIKA
jgi:hypothetical protein